MVDPLRVSDTAKWRFSGALFRQPYGKGTCIMMSIDLAQLFLYV